MRLPLPTHRPARPGLSLLEVIISLAIFLMSLAVLVFLLTLAGNNARMSSQRSHALRLCRSKMSEVISGVVSVQGGGGGDFDEDPDYQWSVEAQQNGSVQGLYNVTVKVSRKRTSGQKLEVTLSQMVLDPTIAGSTQDTPAGPASGTSITSTTTSGSSSGGSSSGM
jgi:type II secretory pathway pseudopilin PulG